MPRQNLRPKDALVLCTVSVLFIYFGLVLWTNYAIIHPYWTPLFWAAALSVPLFFLGSHVANAIKSAFRGYCYVIYIVCGVGSRQINSTGKYNINKEQEKTPQYNLEGTQLNKLHHDDDEDDDEFELRPHYQTLVDQEQDKYARPANWPSYVDLLRLSLVYILLQFTTPKELWNLATAYWSQVQFGTTTQLTYLMLAIIIHMQFVCMKLVVNMIERAIYPNLSPEELEERSILTTASKSIRRAIQESLNSLLATTVVLSTLSILGTLIAILSVGVAHDVQGLLAQTHQRVTTFRYEQALQNQQIVQGSYDSSHVTAPKGPFVEQVDEALSQAYDAGINWFDPILKEAFPDLAWGTTDWAYHVAGVVVNVNQQESITVSSPQPWQQPSPSLSPFVPSTPVPSPPGTCEPEIKKSPELEDILFQNSYANQTTLKDNIPQISEDLIPENEDVAKEEIEMEEKEEEVVEENEEENEEVVLEKPELWFIPTFESLGLPGTKTKSATEFLAQNHSVKAINVSQIKFLLSLILGYKGFNTPAMLDGFNTFNDLLFRWILFLLGLLTFTGLKVSPIQRIGWIVDQALASHESNHGSHKLSITTSPGRSIAKSIEFAITGTFVSMFKLSIYHTIFTLAWTRFLSKQVIALISSGAASPDFVAVKYAWITSLFGIVLILFPIAPNWLVSLPGAIVHFYIYGQRPMEAIALALGHVVLASMVDGAVWDSHVVKNARPGVSSAFWLGLWVFLGGMKWGPKGLLLGPVLFAAIPSIWSALLELRGKPIENNLATNHSSLGFSRAFGSSRVDQEDEDDDDERPREPRRRYRYERFEDSEKRGGLSKSRSRSSTSKLSNNYR
ncbi:hypothetical protein BGZ76_009955 [Entomortierella beljakovae]|nr:hypothetical protein BGZ76_009955 [Entomortierella beljakovae]